MSKKNSVKTKTKATITPQINQTTSKWILITVVGFVLLFIFISISTGTNNETSQSTNSTPVTANEEQPIDDPELNNLANDTEAGLKSARGITSFSELLSDDPSSLMGYINGFENVSNGTVRIILQTPLEKGEAEQVGKAMFSLAAYDNDTLNKLDTLVVRDSSGVDKANIYRKDVPLLNIRN